MNDTNQLYAFGAYLKYVIFVSILSLPHSNFGQACQDPIIPPEAPQTNRLWVGTNKTMYDVNETITFTLYSNAFGSANYTIRKDKFSPVIFAGTTTLSPGVPSTISFQLDHPGFLIFNVTQSSQSASTSIGIDACNIQPVDSLPPDFDSFWAGLRTQLSAVPINPQLTYRADRSDGQQDTYKMTLDNIDGKKVQGWISFPNCWVKQPAVIVLPAYGDGPFIPYTWVAQAGSIVVTLSIHDSDPEQVAQNTYGPSCHFVDPDQNYYKWGILGILRAIDYIHTLPEYNQNGLALIGKSQGAALAVIGAGLDSRVTAVSQSQAALSDHEGLLNGRSSGFPYWVRNYTFCSSKPESEVREAMGYYSVPHFAARFNGPSLNAVGYIDDICPPSTVFSVYNQLQQPKTMIHGVGKGHNGVNPEYDPAEYNFLNTYLARTAVGACPEFVLPLDLIEFKGKAQEKGNLLEWITENEENTASFEIERSADGKRFRTIATVAAKGFNTGRSNYSFLDEAVLPEGYYRLRMLDQDGQFSFSEIIYIASEVPAFEGIEVFPNPFEDKLTLKLAEILEEPAEVFLFDALGKLINKEIWTEGRQFTLDTLSLEGGIYIYQIQLEGGRKIAGRIVCSN